MPEGLQVSDITATISQFVPLDWAIIGLICILVSSVCLRAGVSKANAMTLSVPMAAFLFALLPSTVFVSEMYTSLQAGHLLGVLFLGIYIACFLVIDRLFFSFGGLYGGVSHALIAGCAVTIALIVAFVTIPSLHEVWKFSAPVSQIFAADYDFFWMIATLLMLAFVSS